MFLTVQSRQNVTHNLTLEDVLFIFQFTQFMKHFKDYVFLTKHNSAQYT